MWGAPKVGRVYRGCHGSPVPPSPPGYLEPPVQGALDGDTLAGLGPAGGDSGHQRVQLVPLLLQLPQQALDGAASEGLAVPSLAVAQQAVHDAGAAVTAQGHGAAALQGTACPCLSPCPRCLCLRRDARLGAGMRDVRPVWHREGGTLQVTKTRDKAICHPVP